ncbi:MAG: hypothetical protein AAF170_12165 [Bacteroidota bacterium]
MKCNEDQTVNACANVTSLGAEIEGLVAAIELNDDQSDAFKLQSDIAMQITGFAANVGGQATVCGNFPVALVALTATWTSSAFFTGAELGKRFANQRSAEAFARVQELTGYLNDWIEICNKCRTDIGFASPVSCPLPPEVEEIIGERSEQRQ